MIYVGQKVSNGQRVGKCREIHHVGHGLIGLDYTLNPRRDLKDYAYCDAEGNEFAEDIIGPDFDWGDTSGSVTLGHAQLALALIADRMKDDAMALALHLKLAVTLVQNLKSEWQLPGDALDMMLCHLQGKVYEHPVDIAATEEQEAEEVEPRAKRERLVARKGAYGS